MDFAKVLTSTAEKFPNKPALIFKDKPITFARLKDDSFKLANSLKKIGVKKGDRIAIYLPIWPEYVISYMALFSLGVTVVPLDYMLTMDELVSCLSHSETKLLIARSKEGLSFEELKSKVKSLEKIVLCEEKKQGFLNFEELIDNGEPIDPGTEIKDDDYAMIMYTSGSTGRPKGVLKSYRNLDAAPMAMKGSVKLTDKDSTICCLPLSHDGGFVFVQDCVCYGITTVMMERFIPLEFLKNIQKYKLTCFWLVPPMYYAILQLKEFDKFDLTSLRWVVVFGAPSSPAVLKRFHKVCPNAHFLNGWGMTETMGPTIVLPLDSDNLASIGKPMPWVAVKIVDEDNNELPVGSVGELAIKSWIVMLGYYKDPEATAQVIRNGWLHTGDLARIDEQGFVYIVGRKKEMIKVGGQLVYSPEVEASIHKHPKIAEIAVIGVADKLRGEVPKAFIVLKENETATEEEIRYFAKEHLAHFKIPHYYEFRDSLPKTRTGKIDKEILKNKSKERVNA
ncbi:MAG: AMP-binding protein [Candidatus Omnitrophota bacterium]